MYKQTKATVYAVYWPEINVFKIGFSEFQRWRTFVIRGATVLNLMEFEHFSDAYDFEHACHLALWKGGVESGFRTALEAAPYLGGGGGGYVECFRVPGDLMPTEILKYVDVQLGAFNAA